LQLVLGRYDKPEFDLFENYVERKQISIYDTLIIMEMEHCFAFDPLFEYWTRDIEAFVFVYHVSDRESFLKLPSTAETACNTITPQAAISQPERGGLGASLARRILSKLHLRHREAPPPTPIMVLAVSDMDPKSKRPRQVTSEEGDNFSRSIGAIFLEVSCSWSSGVADPEVKDEARRQLLKRAVLRRVYAEKLAKEGKVAS